MLWELAAAGVLGVVLLTLVLQPLLSPVRRTLPAPEPVDLEETPKGVALAALKEIEFDRETGKLSDADYAFLKEKYTAAAVEAMRAERAMEDSDDLEAMIAARVTAIRSARTASTTPPEPPSCLTCGPRPEPDAVYCSSCGVRLGAPASCRQCGSALTPDSRFCERCGSRVAA